MINNNIFKSTAIFLLFFSYSSSVIAIDNISAAFPFAAQGNKLDSKLEMNSGPAIFGAKTIAGNGGFLDFNKGNINNNSRCDKVPCKVTTEKGSDLTLGPYQPPYFDFTAFKTKNSSVDAVCNSGEVKRHMSGDYRSVVANNNCKIYLANNGQVYISGGLTLNNGSTLYLEPGDYWVNSIVLNTSSIVVNGAGDVNLHVKNDFDLNGSSFGTLGQSINLISYVSEDIKAVNLNNDSFFHGNIISRGKVELNGKSEFRLKGNSRTGRLNVNNQANVILDDDEYWFGRIEMNTEAKLSSLYSGVTTINVNDKLNINNVSKLGDQNHPFLVLMYDNKSHESGRVEINNSAKLFGYLYTKNKLAMNSDSYISGAVNVGDLVMNNNAVINYFKLDFGDEDTLLFYKLVYKPSSEGIDVFACKNEACTELYSGEVTHLNIDDAVNNTSLAKFTKFTESASKEIINSNNCMQFSIKNNNDQGALPYPSNTRAPLQCFIGNNALADCRVCDNPIPLYGYVQGEAIIPVMPEHTEQSFTIKSYDGAAGLFEFKNKNKLLNVGDKINLPLSVSHSQAGKFTLRLNDKDGRHYDVILGFVPKQLVWAQSLTEDACGELSSHFIYAKHAVTCKALTQAASPVTLTIQANDIKGNKIPNYFAELGDIASVNALNSAYQHYGESNNLRMKVNFVTNTDSLSRIVYIPNNIGLIKATIDAHTSPYGKLENGLTALITDGSSSILGRSVPAYFQVSGIAGEIKNGFAYRGKEIEFEKTPYFNIIACSSGASVGCKALPSYSGQFAEGLNKLGNLTFSAADMGVNGPVTINNPSSAEVSLDSRVLEGNEVTEFGRHIIKPSDALGLIFAKQAPRSEQIIRQKLTLTVQIPEDTVSKQAAPNGSAGAALDDLDAKLRYGFIKIFDLELETKTVGLLPLHFNYYGASIDDIEQDSATDLAISTTAPPFIIKPATDELKAEHLTLIKDGVKVAEQASAWEGDIELVVAPWLQPYDAKRCNTASDCLVNPSGHLIIKEQARKRGYDRIFNRREVVR